MVRPRPRVEGRLLHLAEGEAAPIDVDSPAWFAWLEGNGSFAYAGAAGRFTAVKERARLGGAYWRAVRKQRGQLRRVYLGRSRDLTLTRLQAAARALAGEPAPSPSPAAPAPGASALEALRWTRLGVPAPRPRLVSRPHLLDRLRDDALPLVLVVAPAGYGKTTLLADWAAADARRVAWLSLDPADGEPRRFWGAVLAALDALQPGVAARARSVLPALPTMPDETFLSALLQDLAEGLEPDDRGRPALLALDDYQFITDRRVHADIAALTERLPPTLRLVLASREEPPLPLGRLRVRNLVAEVRAADLAFTAAETDRFLSETMGLALGSEATAALAERTEGWAAGLQVAALALREREDTASFVASFRGSHRHVAGYLIQEVVDRQPAAVRRFLLHTAVLDRLCAPLCDAVLGDAADPPGWRSAGGASARAGVMPALVAPPTSQALLERLEAANLFLVPLDDGGDWYRYHHLFAEALRHRLRTEAPELEPALRRRAAAWYETAGYPAEAVEQALAGEDWERAAQLIEGLADGLWRRGEFATLARWLDALPAALLRARPRLAFVRAGLAWLGADFEALGAWLDIVERGLAREAAGADVPLPGGGAPTADTVRARLAVLRDAAARRSGGDEPGALARARAALAALPADDHDWRAYLLAYQIGTIAYACDELPEAERAFEEAAALARAIDDRPLLLRAVGMRAFVLHDRGRLAAAAALLGDARRLAAALDARDLPTMRYVEYADALVRHDRGDLAGAERLALSGGERGGGIPLGAPGLWQGFILARIGLARGDGAAALRAVDAAEAALGAGPAGSTVNHRIWTAAPAWRARIQAATGDLAAVRRWAEEAARLDPAAIPIGWWIYRAALPMLARARLLTGDAAGALALVAGLRARAEAAGAGDALLELLALEALALEALGRREAALAALGRMLALAEPEGYVRPFLDEGAPLAVLLRLVTERRLPGAAYARTLMAPAGAGPAPDSAYLLVAVPFAEPLTEREREVLALTADGLSNRAIAERLFLTVGTVKWHLRTIYAKLDAKRRTEAVARARALGLLH